MDYENYIELSEAIYLFNKLPEENKNNSIYIAIIRILAVNDLITVDKNNLFLSTGQKERHKFILDEIINKNQEKNYLEFYNKAINKSHYFFNSISELEYEIYSRVNFQVSFETGKEIIKYINFNIKKILELGGNSGGLGTAVLLNNKNCLYNIIDTKIPCMIGNEFNKLNNININFIENNIFDLNLENKLFDYIIIMNLLHDFDDTKCLDILNNIIKYINNKTKFLIIEDVLTSEFEPKEIIMHGLRLAVECHGGRQRTIGELKKIFLNINYKLEKIIKLNNIHTMLCFKL